MSKEMACRYYTISADKGKITAQFNYDAMLYIGEGIEMNKEEASQYHTIAESLSKNNENWGFIFLNAMKKQFFIDNEMLFSNQNYQALALYKLFFLWELEKEIAGMEATSEEEIPVLLKLQTHFSSIEKVELARGFLQVGESLREVYFITRLFF